MARPPSITIYQIDAFADRPFAGNPAAVCILDKPADEAWMQSVAMEMNLSETAFLYPADDGFHLRWFTPAVEVDLCGHATLASAHILWERGFLKSDQTARFHTRSGLMTARRDGNWIEMDFPATPAEPADPPDALLRALDVTPLFVGKSRFDFLIEVEWEAAVRSLTPDFGMLKSMPMFTRMPEMYALRRHNDRRYYSLSDSTFQARGAIVTSRATMPGYDFISRYFAPAFGIDEDPVTGSAHCTLAPYWAAKLGKSEMTAYQASKRGGTVRVRHAGERVLLYGRAVTVMVGELACG